MVLYIHPIKQGLKPKDDASRQLPGGVFFTYIQ